MTDLDPIATHTPPVATPDWMGQGTAVEQSRAVAEVQAAVVVAKQMPRDYSKARANMQQACDVFRLADKAFFSYKRGGNRVTGPTIHLARELARCFENIQYGIVELRRDDAGGRSEMMAYAWDVEANTRSATTFIVPHRRDRTDKDGNPVTDPLVALRDVYENNANMAGRRVRQMIFAVLPSYYVDEAEDRCRLTLGRGPVDNASMDDRKTAAVDLFDQRGVSQARLEQKLGRPIAKWDIYDLAQLRVAHKSIERGEITIADEFPQELVTTTEIEAQGESQETHTEAPGAPPTQTGPSDSSEPPSGQGGRALAAETGESAPPSLEEFAEMAARRKVKMLNAIQAQFPDRRSGDLASLEGIYADPEALDAALGWLEENPR